MKVTKVKKSWNQYLLYTILFCLVAAMIYAPFWKNGKTFIWMVDGWSQHYKAMLYYRQWVLTILDNFFVKHTFEIPMFSFSIGYGSDILTTLNYYIIGDPLAVLAVFTPERYMVYCYNFLVVFRIYLAGVAFLAFCQKKGYENTMAILAGTFSYVFCGYVLYAAIRHPFFVNPMIYFPLLLIGVERILHEKKPGFFIGMTAVAAMSNFYFLYMLAIATGLYTVCQVSGRKWKVAVITVLKVAGYALIGIMVAGVFFVPTVATFLGDNRNGLATDGGLLWDGEYYRTLWQNFAAYRLQEDYGMPGLSMIGALLLSAGIVGKNKNAGKTMFLSALFFVFLLFPFFGRVFNGFSYATNRYIWVLNLLLSCLMVENWEIFLDSGKKEWKIYGLILVGYILFGLVFGVTINGAMGKNLLLAIGVVLFFVAAGKWSKLSGLKGVIVVLAVVLSIWTNGNWAYSMKGEYDARLFVTYDMLNNGYGVNETSIAKEIAGEKNGLNRYTSDSVTMNATLQNGLCSTQYFWSLSNPYISRFLGEMAVRENTGINRYSNLDDRMILNQLLSVRYYVRKNGEKNDFVPYGYEKVLEKDGYAAYEGETVLPIGYTYDGYILRSEYEEMNAVERQEAIATAVVLEDSVAERLIGYRKKTLDFSVQDYPYQAEVPLKDLQLEEGCIRVLQNGAKLELAVDGIDNAENYFYIEGLEFEEAEGYNRPENVGITIQSGENQQKTLTYTTEQYIYYQDKHDFVVNLGYQNAPLEKVTIVFNMPGTYRFDSIKIMGQPVAAAEEHIKQRGENTLRNVDLHNKNGAFAGNLVTGEISLDSAQILVLSIPYSKGWKLLVDGEQRELLNANRIGMGVPLKKGEHSICLQYETPGRKMGCTVTLVGLLLWLLTGIEAQHFTKRKFRENTKNGVEN